MLGWLRWHRHPDSLDFVWTRQLTIPTYTHSSVSRTSRSRPMHPGQPTIPASRHSRCSAQTRASGLAGVEQADTHVEDPHPAHTHPPARPTDRVGTGAPPVASGHPQGGREGAAPSDRYGINGPFSRRGPPAPRWRAHAGRATLEAPDCHSSDLGRVGGWSLPFARRF